MNRRPVSDLLTELEGLGADQDHTEPRPGWWRKFWKSRDPPPSPAVEPIAPPPRPEVKPENPPPIPDEQLQALARNLEDSYQIIHVFQTENYRNKGADSWLHKMKQFSSNMTILMTALRQGKRPYGMTLEQMQKDANEIITLQSIDDFGYHDFVFSEYMKSVQEVSSILHDHLHPHPTPPRDADPVVVTPYHDGDAVLEVQDLKNMRFRPEIQGVITEWISLISPTGWTVVDVQRRILHQFRAYVQGIRALLQSPDSASLNIACTLDGNYLCTITSYTPRFPDTPRWDYKRVVLVWPGGRQEAWDLKLDKSPRDGQTYILNFTCSEYQDIDIGTGPET